MYWSRLSSDHKIMWKHLGGKTNIKSFCWHSTLFLMGLFDCQSVKENNLWKRNRPVHCVTKKVIGGRTVHSSHSSHMIKSVLVRSVRNSSQTTNKTLTPPQHMSNPQFIARILRGNSKKSNSSVWSLRPSSETTPLAALASCLTPVTNQNGWVETSWQSSWLASN